MERPNVSVIIPTYNSAATIGSTIEGCLSQDYPREKIEIIVVDDGSEDNTKDVARKFPVKYISQKRGGPASARNNGWRNSKGEVLCFIDADCVPYKDWVSKLVRHCDKKDVGAVAGSYAVDGSKYLLDTFVHYEIKYRHSMMPEFSNSFGTYNVLIKRSAMKELGGFDPSYFRASGEDSDLSYRLIKAGHKIYFEREALVSHHNILRFLEYLRVQFRHSYWRMKLYKKNYSMIVKDEYGYWKDFLEVVLVLAAFIILLLNLQIKYTVLIALSVFLFAIQIPLSLKISFKRKDGRYIIFSLVTFFRAVARILGGIFGFVSFWILRRQ